MQTGTPRLAAKAAQPRCKRWPARNYFVSPRHRLLYCPIPKVACSSLKFWWAQTESGRLDKDPIDGYGQLLHMHRDFSTRYTYDQFADELGDGPLDDPRWFRFAFVRNPWARLVSAFVNKFVQWTAETGAALIAEFRRGLAGRMARRLLPGSREAGDRLPPWWLFRSTAAWTERFTFRQFVNYLATCDLANADGHWRPQSEFLGPIEYRFIGRFERLEHDFGTLNRMLGRKPVLGRINVTSYLANSSLEDEECVADWPLSRLRELSAAPHYRRFYTPSLAQTVGQLYAADVERFGYEFDESAAPSTAVPRRQAA
jgi:hypothetical protein